LLLENLVSSIIAVLPIAPIYPKSWAGYAGVKYTEIQAPGYDHGLVEEFSH